MLDDPVAPLGGRRAANDTRKRTAVQLAAVELSELLGYGAVSVAAIAARSGVNERTVFRTFGSKAGIFWYQPFLQRMVQQIPLAAVPADPVTAVLDAATSAARAMTAQDLEWEARRRVIVLGDSELSAAGTLSMNQHVEELLRRITPPTISKERRQRIALFAVFAAVAIASVPMTADRPVDDWASDLRSAITLAAHGPLPNVGRRGRSTGRT